MHLPPPLTCCPSSLLLTGLRAHLSPPSPDALHLSPAQDCAHTFPAHPWLASEDGQAALKRVLAAYSMHNDKVRRRGKFGAVDHQTQPFHPAVRLILPHKT